MRINRDLYLNKLIRHKGNGMLKVITGLRRCGKSYLLSELFYEHLLIIHRGETKPHSSNRLRRPNEQSVQGS